MTNQKPKIFLSYAHEDIGMAKRIYQDLKRYGLDVWIDCESILPGQNWKIIIEKTIKQSQYYLLLLSSHSINKRGFIQKEMKIAHEMLEQCSEDDIYLIPVRLNECEPSLKISDIHYIDLFPDNEYQNGLKKILQVVSPGTFIIRQVQKELSSDDVNEMVKEHDFYDRDRNPGGKGFNHCYKLKEISGDKVVFDEASELIWQQSGSLIEVDFQNIKNLINEINKKRFFGINYWRLPTLEEAMSLVEQEKKNNFYINPIFNCERGWFWTSDQITGGLRAWVVSYSHGRCRNRPFGTTNFVRAVC